MKVSRRLVLPGMAASILITQSGCFFLVGLLRLGVRGSLIRSGARASRVSRRGKLSSFGRTGATTLHLVRLARAVNTVNRLQKVGEIFGQENEETAVEVESNNSISECLVERVPVSNTRADGKWLVHHSNFYQESIGTSLPKSDTVIEHQDVQSRFAGADVIENGVIRHIDANRDLAGTTPYVFKELPTETVVEFTDTRYLESELNSAASSITARDRATLRDADAMLRAQEACLRKPSDQDCNLLADQAGEALARLEARFK